jgi:hypothetical protein
VQIEVHHAQAGRVVDDLPAAQRLVVEMLPLVAIQRTVVLGDVVVGRDQEAAGARRRIADRAARSGCHGVDHGPDQGPWGEVLPGPRLGVRAFFSSSPS